MVLFKRDEVKEGRDDEALKRIPRPLKNPVTLATWIARKSQAA